MAKRNYTLDNIKQFLEEFGFEWVDYLVFDSKSQKYKTAKISMFNGSYITLYLKRKNAKMLALLTVSNEEFVLSVERNKLNASEAWKEFLIEQKNEIGIN